MITLVGLEGDWPAERNVAWGAAVCLDGEHLLNSFTLRRSPRDELDELVQVGAVTPFKKPIEINTLDSARDVIVLVCRRSFQHAALFRPQKEPELGVHWSNAKSKDFITVVIQGRSVFEAHARQVASNVFAEVTRGRVPEAAVDELLADALVVAQSNPLLLALKARRYSLANASISPLFRARCRTEEAKKEFDEALISLRGLGIYQIKYHGGIAASGGLPLQKASKQLGALLSVSKAVNDHLTETLPISVIASDFPDMNLREIRRSSAILSLDCSTEADSDFQRYLRHAQIEALQRFLDGDIPSDLRSDASFMDALNQLAHPDEDTEVEHQPLDSAAFAPIQYRPVTEDQFHAAESLAIFGYLQGVSDTATKVELAFCPMQNLKLSLVNNGVGEAPLGAASVRDRNDFLYIPALAGVRRFVARGGEFKVFLESVNVLASEDVGTVTALPSAEAPGMVFTIRDTISISAGALHLSIGQGISVRLPTGTLDDARRFLGEFQEAVRATELEATGTPATAWIQLGRRFKPNANQRSLYALSQIPQPATLGQIRLQLSRSQATPAKNNLRRALRERPHLVDEDEAHQTFSLSESGRAVCRVLSKSGVFV